jgi:prepilin-type N-terminal cleavage/methylation domain-containing protein
MIRKHISLQGFSLVELMIVIVIIAILAVFGFLAFQRQTLRGQDVKRKTDLSQLRSLFEDYYNDHDCYPQMATWNAYNCIDGSGGQFFDPYLPVGQKIPCDPVTNERYLYITIPEDQPANISACSGYKLFAALGNLADLDIPGSGCDPDPMKGCGYGPPTYPAPASYKYNYGISIGGTVRNEVFDFSAPTPTPVPNTTTRTFWPAGSAPSSNPGTTFRSACPMTGSRTIPTPVTATASSPAPRRPALFGPASMIPTPASATTTR